MGYTVVGNGANCAVLPPSPYTGDLVMDCSNGPIKLCGGAGYVLHGTIDNSAGCTVEMTGKWTIYYPTEVEPNAYLSDMLTGVDITGATFECTAEMSEGPGTNP